MKIIRLFIIVAMIAALLSGCFSFSAGGKQYSATFFLAFDTVTTVVGTAKSEEAFHKSAQDLYDELMYYHRLFDIYNDYDGIQNLKTVNDNAGIAPVKVERDIIELLLACRTYYDLSGGRVNVCMGSVLKLWHEARTAGLENPEKAMLPDAQVLAQASSHTAIENLIIDEAASTVFLRDPEMLLDVGAVAKGWAVQKVAQSAPAGLLISVGGNVCPTGPKDSKGTPWVVGIQHPDHNGFLHTVSVEEESVVTSGDYQRGYYVEGKFYHHIIDPDTLYPGTLWRSVSVICGDSGLADALSTALFLLPYEDGIQLIEACGAQAVWMDHEGELYYSDAFADRIVN